MTEVRQRSTADPDRGDHNENKSGISTRKDADADDEIIKLVTGVAPDSGADEAAAIPQGSDKTTEALDTALKDLTPRWRNWVIRGIFTWLMILTFAGIIYLGPLALVLLIFAIQIKCFHEIISIGYYVYHSYDLPWFRSLSWYFLFTSNYFFYGESMVNYFGVLMARQGFLYSFITYHRFISFSLYVAGFVGFVFSLVKKHYLKQFTLFGWTHVTLLIVVTQSHLIIQNVFEGLVWLLVPVSIVICNDIMAYIFGFFFGKTPLIKLSPKKTWEGFIGGAIATIVFSILLSLFLVRWDFLVCPISYNEEQESLSSECQRDVVFKIAEYNFPVTLQSLFNLLHIPWGKLYLYPFCLHSISMALFASVIGPFGGFFASGFKRAFKIKDFGDTIPGHGGIMDRFDCQFLMATFVHVYHSSFIRSPSPQRILQTIVTLKPEEQLQVFTFLRDRLSALGLLNVTST